ncbi:predicted protein [Postia placenta Mad-698-R]|uniref:PLC-like phosphodiesterase n=1 Tax=Postia placenta MAD-698-R-SB12 TaxID=670580 RepID=A0A1X6NEU1_9APHY|nr:hypothetical protein POSPLADRAFT_1068270 [Postia placenta MAD-698-R-SB12]EED80483.1 predicted protein [Postia placenta Mad-698-R]OSX66893.1 hypothetical protein POSPLADRAFT_1068270 [Postia placenta MAD-698-R-SB12]
MLVSLACITQVVLLLLLVPKSAAHALAVTRATPSTCNGYSQLCDRSYGNVTFVGAHDSYAVSSTNLAANQDYNVTQQLKDGVRMLQLQAHNQSGVIQLCHTSCGLLNGGTLANYLNSVKSWMDENPNEVVSMLIVNSYDNILPAAYATVFSDAGLDSVAYAPTNATVAASAWPTLGDMISSGKRLVVFLTTRADYQEVPYLIDEFTNIWETAYDVTTTFDCAVNRTNGNSNTQMYLINHFLDIDLGLGLLMPDKDAAAATNGVSGANSLGQQAATCVSDYHRSPNFMLVDFYEYGNGSVFQVAATANGVTYSPSTPIAQAGGSSSSSSATTGGALPFMRVTPAQLGASFAVTAGVFLGALSVL